jgi:hypothetical protein
MWGALSDERMGLQFAMQSLNGPIRAEPVIIRYFLLSPLRLPQLGGPGSHIYIPQKQDGPLTPPGTGLPLRRLFRILLHCHSVLLNCLQPPWHNRLSHKTVNRKVARSSPPAGCYNFFCVAVNDLFTTLRQTASQYVLVSSTLGLVTGYYLLPEGCCLFCGATWREDRPAGCSAITQWSESRRTRNHTLLSYLRLPQPWRPGSRIYIPRNRVAQLYLRALGSLYVVSSSSWLKLKLILRPTVSRSWCRAPICHCVCVGASIVVYMKSLFLVQKFDVSEHPIHFGGGDSYLFPFCENVFKIRFLLLLETKVIMIMGLE